MVLGLGVCANISLKKSGMYGNGGLLTACGLDYQWCPLLLFWTTHRRSCKSCCYYRFFWEVGKFPTELVLVYIIAQCIGAFIVALIVWLLFKDHLDEEDNQNCQLGSFATIATNSNNLRNLLSEIVTTFSLLFILFTLNHQQPTNGVAMFFVLRE